MVTAYLVMEEEEHIDISYLQVYILLHKKYEGYASFYFC